MNRYYQIGISFLLILVINACGTKTKKKGDVPWLKRNYHSLTTKYNYYYNANVLLQDGIAKLNAAHQDNYNQILDMFPYSAVENVEIVKGDMDNAIKKMTTAASVHRFGGWVDDCALLMGKAQYLKKDYEAAEETLAYLTEEFKPSRNKKVAAKEKKQVAEDKKKETKKKQEDKKKLAAQKKKEQDRKKKEAARAKEKAKKDKAKGKKPVSLEEQEKAANSAAKQTAKKDLKDEETEKETDDERLDVEPKDIDKAKPKRYFLKRRPAYQEGMVWLARTYTERKKFEEANDILITLLKNRSTFRDVRRSAAQFYAYNFLKQKEYAKAIKPLERAIKLTKNKKEKARFYFILGQIQEKLGHDAEALNAYDKVLSYKSIPYDMEFSARMNVALFAYTKGQGSSDDAIKSLTKMTKEAKNADYLDQIYFALAQIALKNNDKKMAIEHLRNSLSNSKKNASQKAEAYLMMANLLYESENYLPAKNYYDSTITVLPKTDERYDEAKRLAFGLTDIAKNIKIIQMQDSLLRIADMSVEQQKAFCLRMKQKDIEAIEKAEEASKKAALSSEKGSNSNDFAISYGPGITPSTFFAYNFKGLQQGKRNFEQKWGRERKLEDNWRRKNKKPEELVTPLADGETEKDKEVKRDKSKITDDEFRKMMANVPQNEMQKEAANGEVANAMLALGKAYRESLQRNDKCIATLEELLRRYPNTKNELEALYQLYNAYSDTGKSAKAKECFDKIVSKYPNTTYARILSDPDFAKKTRREGQDLEDYYKLTYEAFSKGQFKTAYERSSKADSLFKKNTFKPKFALLAAMSAGNMFGKDRYIGAIKDVIAKFPETAEQKRAKEILRLLDGGEAAYQEALGGASSGPYKREDDVTHYVIVVITDKNAKIEDAKSSVADFNKDNYKTKNLKISNVFFGDASDIPMLVIRKFEDRAEAMKYYYHVEEVKDAFMPEKMPFEVFAISQNNYKELLKDKTTDVYKAFFEYSYKGN